jgi:hypothetical protein
MRANGKEMLNISFFPNIMNGRLKVFSNEQRFVPITAIAPSVTAACGDMADS